VLEDANSIQMSLMQIMRLLLTGQIENKTASLLLYALQMPAPICVRPTSNRGFTRSSPTPRDAAESILIKTHLWDDEDFEEEGEEEEVDEVEQEIRQKEEEAARKPASSPVGKRRRTSKPVSAAANATRRKRS
jgi:hypothetical protein